MPEQRLQKTREAYRPRVWFTQVLPVADERKPNKVSSMSIRDAAEYLAGYELGRTGSLRDVLFEPLEEPTAETPWGV